MKVELLVCAEKILREANSDSVSAINLLEDIVAEAFPAHISISSVLIVSIKEDGDDDIMKPILKVINNKSELAQAPITVNFTGKEKANSILRVNNLTVPEKGKLTFAVYAPNDLNNPMKTYSINIKLRTTSTTIIPESTGE